MILALDTATSATAVALAMPGGRVLTRRHEPSEGERPGHATQLLQLAFALLDEAGVTWSSLERLAVGIGPGTFTGLRIGVATARGLAQAHELPLVGVSTLQGLALATAASGEPAAEGAVDSPPIVLAAIDARRGEAFAAAWTPAAAIDPAAAPALAPAAFPPEALSQAVVALTAGRHSVLAVGDGAIRFREHLEAAGAVVPADDSPHHRVDAAAHCRLAAAMEPTARDMVLPAYLRLPDAELALRQRRAEQR